MPNGSPLILPTIFCPGPAYYRTMLAHQGPVIIDTATRFDKRDKQAHRCLIADTHGPIELTVPIAKPYGTTWADTRISFHGDWWLTARTLLESAYSRTPYYEFYADDINPLLDPAAFTTVADLNRRFDTVIRHCLNLPAEVTYRPLAAPHHTSPDNHADAGPYWQIRADRLGYLPGLSTLDLIFNLGPEALLYLK